MTFSVWVLAAVATFSNKVFTYTLEDDGTTTLTEKASKRDLLSQPLPYALLYRTGGGTDVVRSFRKLSENEFAAVFGGGGEVTFKVNPFKNGYTFEITGVTCKDWETLELARFQPTCNQYVGWSSNVVSDDDSALALRAYDPELDMVGSKRYVAMRGLSSRGSLVGHKFGLTAGPRKDVMLGLKHMTRETGLRISKCGGAWALDSEMNRRGYFFAHSLNYKTVDKWIDMCKLTGIGVIHCDGWYRSLGQYEIRKEIFPSGVNDMRKMTDRVHAEGYLVGMHHLSGCISMFDAYVTPTPHPDLMTEYSYTLAQPLKNGDTEMVVNEEPGPNHDVVYSYSSNGNFFQLGSELIQYTGIRREKPYAFTGLIRGYNNTKPGGPYPAGMKIKYLHQHYKGFFPELYSELSDKLADRIAFVLNKGNFDQTYFDGADTGLGDAHAVDVICRNIYNRFDHQVITEGGGNKSSWWWRSRFGAWDSPYWGLKRFTDTHVQSAREVRMAELVQPQMGWWAPRAKDRYARGNFIDEMEYFAGKCAAIDGVASMQSFDPVKGLSDEQMRQFKIFGDYEKLRLAHAFTPKALKRLGQEGAEFRLKQAREDAWALVPVTSQVHRVSGECGRTWTWNPGAGKRLSLRFEALYLAGEETPGTVVLKGGALPLQQQYDPPNYLNIKGAEAFKFKVKGDGSGRVLHFQFLTPKEHEEACSDHYLKIDFTGWRDVVFLVRERDASGIDAYQPPKLGHYETFRTFINFEHVSQFVAELVGEGSGSGVEISDVVACKIAPQRPIKPVLSIGDKKFTCPFTLKCGDYAELEVNGKWTYWTEDGMNPKSQESGDRFEFPEGECKLSVDGDPGLRVEVSLFALGKPFIATKPKE